MNEREPDCDSTSELIESMKEGFAIRLADVEAEAERYRLALVECQRILENEHLYPTGSIRSHIHITIGKALQQKGANVWRSDAGV